MIKSKVPGSPRTQDMDAVKKFKLMLRPIIPFKAQIKNKLKRPNELFLIVIK